VSACRVPISVTRKQSSKQLKRDESIIPIPIVVVVVRGTIAMDLHCSDATEQESDEQEDCLLWHDRLSELDSRIEVISCPTNSNSNRRFMRRRL
jgi:hypothetical protein